MADEFVFAIDGNNAVPAVPITLAEAGLKEREHLQEWVLKIPQILGPGSSSSLLSSIGGFRRLGMRRIVSMFLGSIRKDGS